MLLFRETFRNAYVTRFQNIPHVAKYRVTFHNSNTDNIYNNVLFTVSNNNAQYRAPFPRPGNSVSPSDHWRHHIQVMSSNLAPGFDQRLIMVILTTLDKGDFASLASTNSLNQHCLQDRLNTYSLHAQQANPLTEFSYTFVNNWYISFQT